MTSVDTELDAAEAARDDKQGTARVVLLSVQVPLEALPAAIADRLPTEGPVEAWIAVAARSGAVESAIRSFSGGSGEAGNTPGSYKAVPRGSWFVPPITIEPALD